MSTIVPHTTRAAGTVLTAAVYNGDHGNHVTNATALNTDKVETSRAITTSDGLQGGGDLSANRALSPDYATLGEAQAGTSAVKVMSPLRAKDLLTAVFGAWTAYTPTITAGTGTLTTAGGTGSFIKIGKTVLINIQISITTNGTADSYISFTLPSGITSIAGYQALNGREENFGAMLQARIAVSATVVDIFTYNNAYPGGSGYYLYVSGTFEAA